MPPLPNMKKALKILAYVATGLLVVAAGVLVYVLIAFNRIWTRTYDVPRHDIVATTGEASLVEGQRLLKARGCTECHGEDLGGRYFLDDPALGRLYARNLTPGRGGRVGSMSDLDLERAIRHGVTRDGTPLVFMPADEFWHMSDADLGKIIQAIRAQPPVDREPQPNELTLLAKGLGVFGVVHLAPAARIAQQQPHEAPPAEAVSVEYGKYLAVACAGCHGETYSGGRIPGTPPSIPVPANLTPAPDGLGRYTEAQFMTMLRTGQRPDGTTINEFMPWKVYGHMTDMELKALYQFLHSLPPRPFGGR